MTYSISAVAAFELPVVLLDQKPGYNVDEFMKVAMAAPERFFAYIIDDGENDICCSWACYNLLYRNIHIDTFVVDEEARKKENCVRDCMRITVATYEALAREIGAKKVSWSSPPKLADHMVKVIDDDRLKVEEWVLSIDIAEEAEPDE